jgi:hypothetical protein
MSWFNKNYQKRQIVSIPIFGGAGTANSYDIELDIPKDWDTFWDNIRSDMIDVVLYDGNNGTVLDYQRKAGADYANRVLTLQVQDFPSPHNDSLNAIFLYYHYPSESTDRASSITMGGPSKTGYILLENPYGRIVPGGIGSNADDQPIVSFSKSQAGEVDVFFIFNQYFGDRVDTYNDRLNFEEMNYAIATAYLSNGTVSTALTPDNTYMRFGNGFVRARWKAGDDSADYAIVIKMISSELQVVETRAVMRVKNLLPS